MLHPAPALILEVTEPCYANKSQTNQETIILKQYQILLKQEGAYPNR